MRLFSTGALLAVALASSGCSGCQTLSALTGATPIAGATAVDDKAMYVAEAAMYGADTAAHEAVKSGVIVPGSPMAVRIADDLRAAHGALVAARDAKRVGDATSATGRISAFQSAIGDVWSLMPQKGVK